MTTILWTIDSIPVEVTVSNIEWDNDSVGVTDYGGNIKDDIQADYISSFDVDNIDILQPIDDMENIKILRYKYNENADFITKLEEAVKYD